jgi:outer membrane immunogenic protein
MGRLTSFAVATAAAAFAFGAIQTASAADLPVKAAPVVAPVGWTGWYAGVNVGGVFGDSRDTLSPTGCFIDPAVLCGGPLTNNPLRTDTGHLHDSGFTGGGQIGYNWQTSVWVYGLETDINYSSLNENDNLRRALVAPLGGLFTHSVNSRLDWFGTFRGRIGWTGVPSWLWYATGGLAYGHVNSSSAINFTAAGDTYAGSSSSTRVGWTAGVGAEWQFAPMWSGKIEYLYIDLDRFSYGDACIAACGGFVPAPSYRTSLDVRDHVVRLGINYHFR